MRAVIAVFFVFLVLGQVANGADNRIQSRHAVAVNVTQTGFYIEENEPIMEIVLQKAVQKKGPGNWVIVRDSTAPGYGVMYCVSDKKGTNPDYFWSDGHDDREAAFKAAKKKALDGGAGRKSPTPFLCGTWHNK